MGGFHSSARNHHWRSKNNAEPKTNAMVRHSMIEAAAVGDLSQLQLLIARRVDVDACDSMGRTALHLACAEGHCHIVRFLIEHGSSLTIEDRFGNDPLQEAIRTGHKEVIEILSLAGANYSGVYKAALESKLCGLAFAGNLKEMECLIHAGISPSCTDYLGNSPLHLAVQERKHGVAEYLLQAKAGVNCINKEGDTPLKVALRNHDDYLADLLFKAASTDPNWSSDAQQSSLKGANVKRQVFNRSDNCNGEMFLRGAGNMQASAGRASFAVIQACPTPIARALLNKNEIQPVSCPIASLFFSDVVGFTKLSSGLTAEKVSAMLSTLVKAFDRLAYIHGVQKVDVIGDAYIAATNFTEDQPADHAARLARFAIAAVAAAAAVPVDLEDPDGPRLQVRVGMHSGPCTGIVTNHGAPKYTLVGKAARVAARMESGGAPGLIQCSAASAKLIKKQGCDIELRPRNGGVEVDLGEGLDRIPTYWVFRGRRRRLSADDAATVSLQTTRTGFAADLGGRSLYTSQLCSQDLL